MATAVPGGGLTREFGELWYMPLLDATTLNDAGYVLGIETESTVRKVDILAAAEIPYAINWRSTRDPHDQNFPQTLFLTGAQIGTKGVPVLREGWAKVKVADNNSLGVAGDPVIAGAGGKIDIYTATAIGDTSTIDQSTNIDARFGELSRVIGNLEEALPAGTTSAPGKDKVLVHLTIGNTGLIPA